MVDTEALLTKSEQRALQALSKQELSGRLRALGKDDVRAIAKQSAHSSKKEKQARRLQIEQEEARRAEEEREERRREKERAERAKESADAEQRERRREEKLKSKAAKREAAVEALRRRDGEIKAVEADIVRNVNYAIMKSKGLTRKRKKEDRNSRVKFREKYRRALQKRKSRGVHEYEEGPKGKYAGEGSGLKVGVIRSTKLS